MSWLALVQAVVDSGGVSALAVAVSSNVDVVVGDEDVFMVVVCREVLLVRTGTVVFHWCVEKGLVTLEGSVMSWSPTVERSDSGTVGRSQAGRLLTESSTERTHFKDQTYSNVFSCSNKSHKKNTSNHEFIKLSNNQNTEYCETFVCTYVT